MDTSVAVPMLVRTHAAHDDVSRWCRDRDLALSGHALVETYAVLTRLPGDLRVVPADAVRLIRERCAPALVLGARMARRIPELLADQDISGGATYDALIALAAIEHGAELATRDARARATYEVVGATVVVVA